MRTPIPAVVAACLLTAGTTPAAPKDALRAKPRAVCAPVETIAFHPIPGDFGGLTVTLRVDEGDPRWADREIRLPGYNLFIAGRPAKPSGVVQWAATVVRPGAAWRAFPAELIEVTVVLDPDVYGGVGRADFRVVSWARHYPWDEIDAQVTFFLRRRGVEVDELYTAVVGRIRAAFRAR